MHQMQETSLDTTQRQAKRQDKVIARQVARSAYNMVLAEAKAQAALDKNVNQIVSSVGVIQGTYYGDSGDLVGSLGDGTDLDNLLNSDNNGEDSDLNDTRGVYKAWLTKISPTAYRATAVAKFRSATHRIEIQHKDNIVPNPPSVEKASKLKVTFTESMAGYCSAVYLQRYIPKNNNGHGNNEDGVDASNPGNSKTGEDSDPTVDDETKSSPGQFRKLEPELVFAPGNNRNGAEANFEEVIAPGTRLNFILAVDADYSCESEGDTTLAYDDPFYDYTRESFSESITKLGKLSEGAYTLMQEKPGEPGTWRIAFEDLIFGEERLWDIKENGYDGNGWETDGDGYWKLKDFGHKPDFSDQVIEVKIVPTSSKDSEDKTLTDG